MENFQLQRHNQLNEDFITAVNASHYARYDRLFPYADVNAVDQYGYSALHYAAKNGDIILMKSLIRAGANVNFVSKDRLNPFAYAMDFMIRNDFAFSTAYENVVELLIKSGAEKNSLEPLYEYFKPSILKNQVVEVEDFITEITYSEEEAEANCSRLPA